MIDENVHYGSIGSPGMVNESEVIALFLAVVVAGVFLILTSRDTRPRIPFFYSAYGLITLGFLFTILEGFFYHDLFNLLEHAAYASAACSILAGVLNRKRNEESPE